MKKVFVAAFCCVSMTSFAWAQPPRPTAGQSSAQPARTTGGQPPRTTSGQPAGQPSGQAARPAASAPAAQPSPAANKVKFDSDRQRLSYGLGLNIGSSLANDRVDVSMVDIGYIARGIADVLANAEPSLTPDEHKAAMEMLGKQLQTIRDAEKKTADEKNTAFLAQKKKEGFKATDTGLLYKVITEGDGPSPKLTDKVKVHYEGKFPNGTVFDSSLERKEPLEQQVQGFIEGWVEALQMMKAGGKWSLVVPPELAYGDMGTTGIPPHSVLTFDIELLEIAKDSK